MKKAKWIVWAIWALSGIVSIIALANAYYNDDYTYSLIIGDVCGKIFTYGLWICAVIELIARKGK